MEEDEETTPIKQLNIEDKDGVLHQYEIKDAKAREDIDSASILDFDNKQFVVSNKQTSIGITIQTDIENQGNYLRGDGNWVDLSAEIPVLNQESDYLKVSLDKNGETIYGGMIGNHNINSGNAGKILRINTEGTDLELIRFTGGLTYNEIDSSEWGADVTAAAELNSFNDYGTIPAGVHNINFLFEKPIDPEAMPNGIIHFELPPDTELLDVNVFYNVAEGEYEECNYSYLNEKDYKYPKYFNPGHIYQITLTNHNAAFFDFSENVHEKKNYIQQWYLDPNSEILHHFDDGLASGSPFDSAGFGNEVNQIERHNDFEYHNVTESAGFGNSVYQIKFIPDYETYNVPVESAGFGNSVQAINISENYGYYSKSNDNWSVTNELTAFNKTTVFKYTTSALNEDFSVNNELVNLVITPVEIDGYTREG